MSKLVKIRNYTDEDGNFLYQNCSDSSALSTQKSLPEKLAAELIAIWFYCQSPTLCQAEYEQALQQALRLFESTLRKYLALDFKPIKKDE